MSDPFEAFRLRSVPGGARGRHIVPSESLTSAFLDMLRLLFQPFDLGRWVKLSVICVFLGGGTVSAAFDWSLGALPADVGLRAALERTRAYVGGHWWTAVLAVALGLALGLAVVYLRSVLRFVLVRSIFKNEVAVRATWREVLPLGRSYFLWLLATLAVFTASLVSVALAAFFYLRSFAVEGIRSLAFSIALINVLVAVAIGGAVLVLGVTVTDDFVVPLMYAERIKLFPAWRKLWKSLRSEPGTYTLYILLRFGLSLAIGIVVLLVLFPVLLSVFSAVVIVAAIVALALKVVGFIGIWNQATVVTAPVGLILLSVLVLVLLSLAGLPGQVLLQSFGMRFATSRFPSLELLWQTTGRARPRRPVRTPGSDA